MSAAPAGAGATSLHPTTCPLDCPDACGVLAEVDPGGRLVRLRGNPAHGYSRGVLCGKTMLYPELVASAERLTTPLVRSGGDKRAALLPATWDEALERIVERVRPLVGEEILALWYGGSMGLVQRKFPLRMMHALGATLHDGGICDSASTAGYESVLGRVVGPDIEEADDCDLVILWGSDVARTVQHLQPALQRLCRRGVPVVAIDVYRTDTIEALERWGGRGRVIRPGTDAALALAIARIAFEDGFADRAYLARECLGAVEFEAHVRAHLGRDEAAAITGLAPDDIAELAHLFRHARRPLIKTGVGWTRRRNGAMGMRAVCSLAAVLGAGERVHYESFAHFDLAEDAIVRPDLRPESSKNEPVQQVTLGRHFEAGRFKAAFVWCHNPAVTLPDSRRVRAGLAREDLFVVVHEHFLTETAELADVVLPATMFVEHDDVYRSYGHRWMQLARAAAVPPQSAKSNVEAFSAIARALGLQRETWDVDALGLARELFAASRLRLSVDDIARLERGEPVKPRAVVHADHGTPSGRIELVSAAAGAAGQPRMATYVADDAAGDRGAFWLVGAPSIHTHNSTFAHSARHVHKAGPPACHVNPDDARVLGLVDGARARIANDRGAITLPIVHSPHMPRGLVRVDGLPRARDIAERVGLNALTSGALSDLGQGNVMYSARVDLAPID